MAQAGFTPISLYYSTTAAATPSAGNLVAGELALNTVDEKLYFKNSAGTVKLLASNATSAPVLSFSAGTTGFTPSTATTGAVTLAGTLGTANGGTNLGGATPFTSGGVVYASSTSALATGSALLFDGTNMGIGGTPVSSAGYTALTLNNATNSGYVVLQKNASTVSDWYVSGGTEATFRGVGVPLTLISTGANYIRAEVNGSERMRITSAGNVGIGTSSPSVKLRVESADADYISVFRNTNASGYGLQVLTQGSGTNLAFQVRTNAANTDAFQVLDSGNVGIGTTSPQFGIDLRRGSGANAYLLAAGNNNGTTAGLLVGQDTTGLSLIWQYGANPITFWTNSTERTRISSTGGFSVGTTADPGAGAIYATGNITAYYSSDIKFKENVRDIPDALATVNAIGGKLFDWKDDYIESKGGADGYFVQKADFGVVAQDVQKVFPIAVRTREDGSLAVDYEKLGALAFAALVELTKRVEALEAK